MYQKVVFFRLLVIKALLLITCSSLAYAKVTVQPDFKGTLLVTTPDGNIEMYDEGEAVPEIVANSVIEVFGGKFTVATEAGDTVSCGCLDHTMTVGGGASAALTCEEESGGLKALKGSVPLIDSEDKEHIVAEGQEYPIKPSPVKPAPPPTEAAEEIGVPAAGELPPVDSRSIETSPSS